MSTSQGARPPITPVDPESPRGRELAAELTVALDDVEDRIARDRAKAAGREPLDVDALPPTQYLILEVLAARYRTGETHWTFPDRVAPAARALEQAGLVWLRSGPAPHAFEARFTDAGRALMLSDTWPGIRVTAVVNWRRERVHGITGDPDEAMQWVREINERHGDPLAATQCADVVRPGVRR